MMYWDESQESFYGRNSGPASIGKLGDPTLGPPEHGLHSFNNVQPLTVEYTSIARCSATITQIGRVWMSSNGFQKSRVSEEMAKRKSR